MIKLAIFDLDGTLINSIEDLADATNYALNECGFEIHEVEKYYYFVGNGLNNLIMRAIPETHRNEETIIKITALFADYYSKNYCNKTYIYDGITNMVSELKARGIKLAVASNKPDEPTKIIVKKLFGEDTFDYIQGNKKGVPHKPHPQIIYDVLRNFEIEEQQAIMIGDTDIDINTGKNAGLKTIGCLWGFREINELQKAGADLIASHPNDILEFIK